MTIKTETITGVILAGGKSTRMAGKDKGLMQLHGIPLYQHVLNRLRPQVHHVLINANRNLEQYRLSGATVIQDTHPYGAGPLAGILSGLQNSTTEWVVFAPCDTPFLPTEFVSRLWLQRHNAQAVWAATPHRQHPVTVLLHRNLCSTVQDFLLHGHHRVRHFLQQVRGHAVMFTDETAFININTPDALRQAHKP